LVLMWMRQQPAMAEIAKDTGFAQFYAELKVGIMQVEGDSGRPRVARPDSPGVESTDQRLSAASIQIPRIR